MTAINVMSDEVSRLVRWGGWSGCWRCADLRQRHVSTTPASYSPKAGIQQRGLRGMAN